MSTPEPNAITLATGQLPFGGGQLPFGGDPARRWGGSPVVARSRAAGTSPAAGSPDRPSTSGIGCSWPTRASPAATPANTPGCCCAGWRRSSTPRPRRSSAAHPGPHPGHRRWAAGLHRSEGSGARCTGHGGGRRLLIPDAAAGPKYVVNEVRTLAVALTRPHRTHWGGATTVDPCRQAVATDRCPLHPRAGGISSVAQG